MDYSSDEESEFSDSEFSDYKDKPYDQLRNGTLKVKYPNGIFRCPFCAGKKKQNFKYKDLHQHASGVGKASSNRNAKQKANHLALTFYLENELADEAEKPVKVGDSVPAAPISKDNDLFCWPWTGIVVNIVKDSDSGNEYETAEYWIKRFSKYRPEDVELLVDPGKRTATALVMFNSDLIGFNHAMEFEKAFIADHHGKKEWSASENSSSSRIYGWLARADDFETHGQIGEYLRMNMDLKPMSEAQQEDEKSRKRTLVESEIDMTYEMLDDFQIKCNQNAMYMRRTFKELDNMHQALYEECEHVKRVLSEIEMLKDDVEEKKKKNSSWSKEIDKREAETEVKRQKFEEDKRRENSSLHMASIEQRKTHDYVQMLAEEQQREKEEARKYLLDLQRQLDAYQQLQMEIEELKGKVRVTQYLVDDDDTSVQEKINRMNDELQEKIHRMNDELQEKEEKMDGLEDVNQTLMIRARRCSDELLEARQELIKVLQDKMSKHTTIGVKRMGEIDMKPFVDACKEKFRSDEVEVKAIELCSLWQEKLKNPEWHPVKVVAVDGTYIYKEVINEDDELLKTLKAEWGSGISDAVTTAYMEMNEYNPCGRYVVSEFWNFKENRRASLKEVIGFIVKNLKLKHKRKREQDL